MHGNLNKFIFSEMKDTNKIHKKIGVSRYYLLSEIKLINLVHFKNLRLIESFLSYSHFNHVCVNFIFSWEYFMMKVTVSKKRYNNLVIIPIKITLTENENIIHL